MNAAAAQNFNYDTAGSSSTSGAAMLLIWQILPQLQLLKNCRDGWHEIASAAKGEVETLRLRLTREELKFREMEAEYITRMSSLRLKIQKAYDEKDNMKNILLDTTIQLKNFKNHSRMIVLNFSREKDSFMKQINDNNKYILTNKEFLKNISIELREMIMNKAIGYNTTLKNENNFEHEIRHSLAALAELIKKMKQEQLDKNNKINEASESYDELMMKYKNCLSSNEELQDELNEAKELEEDLKKIKQEKQQLQDIKENLLKKILLLLEGTTVYQNVTLEMILKQTSSAAKGIRKYIVEPAEEAENLMLKSILKNHTKEEALISAAKEGNLTEISILLDYGADIEAQDSSAWKLKSLHWVADQGYLNATRLLLLRGADVNARTSVLNVTALHIAVNKNHLNVIDLLLKGGADIEARDNSGYTPLFRAAARECATAKLLVDRGANVSTADNQGFTAVFIASPSECMRELLCSKGATDPRCRTQEETATTAMPCSVPELS